MDNSDAREDPAEFEESDLIRLHSAYKCRQREAGALQDQPFQCHVARCQDMRGVVTHLMSCPAREDPAEFEESDLIRLHSAYKCRQREAGALQDQPFQCHVARCQDMRGVVTHLMSCPSDRKCSRLEDCSLLRQKIKVLVGCEEEECPICIQKLEWQMSISADQRSNMIDLLVQTYQPHYSHIKVLHAQTVEKEIYKKATNGTDYYRMLAAKKWEMEMDMEERRHRLQDRRFRENMVLGANVFEEARRFRQRAIRMFDLRFHGGRERPDAQRRVRRQNI